MTQLIHQCAASNEADVALIETTKMKTPERVFVSEIRRKMYNQFCQRKFLYIIFRTFQRHKDSKIKELKFAKIQRFKYSKTIEICIILCAKLD